MHDGASARMYADQGYGCGAEAQDRVAGLWRRLVAEIRTARGNLEAIKPHFQTAKDELRRCPAGICLPRQSTNERRLSLQTSRLNLTRVPRRSRIGSMKPEVGTPPGVEDKKSIAEKAEFRLTHIETTSGFLERVRWQHQHLLRWGWCFSDGPRASRALRHGPAWNRNGGAQSDLHGTQNFTDALRWDTV